MIKRLSILNGLAIIGVVIAHAGLLGQEALFTATMSPIGTFTYYALLAIRQLSAFSVPAFFFISGFFVAYTFQGSQDSSNRKNIIKRLIGLLIPYLIWSSLIFLSDFYRDKNYTLIDYLVMLVSKGAIGAYWFIPTLSYFYILSLAIALFTKNHWKMVLYLSASIQLVAMCLYYLFLFNVNVPGINLFGKIFPYSQNILSIFFFTFGIAFGFNVKKFKEFLLTLKMFFWIALPFFALFIIGESDILIRKTLNVNIVAFLGTMSFNLYSLTFICWFLTLKNIPQLSGISWIGRKSYGIYLLHFIFMQGLAILLFQFAPQINNSQILFILLLISVGLGIPLIIMYFFEKTPARRFYHYLFG